LYFFTQEFASIDFKASLLCPVDGLPKNKGSAKTTISIILFMTNFGTFIGRLIGQQ
jgi:hypothetical protein